MALFLLADWGFTRRELPGRLLRPVRSVGSWLDMTDAQVGCRPKWPAPAPPGGVIVLGQLKESALPFTTRNLRHWYQPGQAMLFPLPATLFLLGVVLLLLSLPQLPSVWLALWLLTSILSGGLTESTPAAQRYVFVALAVAILVTWPIIRAVE